MQNYPGIGKKTFLKNFKKIGVNLRIVIIKLKTKQKLLLNKRLKLILLKKKPKSQEKTIINFLIKLKNFKGIRHKLKYPSRGQRTHTNAKTKKKISNKILVKNS